MSASDVKAVTFDLEAISLEELQSNHRRGRKELQAKIQEMKKNAPKSDKKKRKEANEAMARLESELEQRYASELKTVQAREESTAATAPTTKVTASESTPSDGHCQAEDGEEQEEPAHRISKAQKRRDKKAREAKERAAHESDADSGDAANALKTIEWEKILQRLNERQLEVHSIPSDGDCMYNAVRHQLIHQGVGAFNLSALRRDTADYIRDNKDVCICYMVNPQSGDLLTDDEFEAYCNAVERTHAWGGQLELQALSAVHGLPIEVLQAEGPPTVLGPDKRGPRLTITYHRHLYSLGEHYNSTLPRGETADDVGDSWEKGDRGVH